MVRYTIIVEGHIPQRWSASLARMDVQHEPNGHTRISGTLPDQSALISVLMTLHNLNITLFSLERVTATPSQPLYSNDNTPKEH